MKRRAEPPHHDPVSQVFTAIVQARRASPDSGGEWRVAVRSRTGQLMALFTLGSDAQVFDFAARVRLLGYRMAERKGGRDFDFCLDRRAANEALHHPLRRQGD